MTLTLRAVHCGKWVLLAFFLSLVGLYPWGWVYSTASLAALAAFGCWHRMATAPRGRHAR